MTHLEFAPTTATRAAFLPREDSRHVLEGMRARTGSDIVAPHSEASDASRHVRGLGNQESGAVLLRDGCDQMETFTYRMLGEAGIDQPALERAKEPVYGYMTGCVESDPMVNFFAPVDGVLPLPAAPAAPCISLRCRLMLVLASLRPATAARMRKFD